MADLGAIVFLALNPYNGGAYAQMSEEDKEPFRRAAEKVLSAVPSNRRVEVIYDEHNECWDLILMDENDNITEVLGSDGGEPEDQLLVRDWDWVPTLVQKLLNQISNLQFLLENQKAKTSAMTRRRDWALKELSDLAERATSLEEDLDIEWYPGEYVEIEGPWDRPWHKENLDED